MATHFSTRGNVMDRGTLMVLKRLLMTALGALSLGALAAGPVSAQQIPAPDAYGDPQACAASIKAETAAADMGEVGDNGLTPTQTAALTNMARPCAGDVGAGIEKARTLYQAVVDAKAELDAAEKAYEDDDSARNLEERDEAKGAHINAVAARNAYSGGGTIYEAVYTEEGRIADANEADSAWMKADQAATDAEMLRDTVELENYVTDFAGYDATGQAYEFETYTVLTTAADPDNNVDAVYTTYVRVKKQGGATVGPQLIVDSDGEPVLDGDGNRTYEVPDALDTGIERVMPDGTSGGNVTFVLEEDFDHDLDDETDGITFLRVSAVGDILEDSTIGGVNMEYMTAKMTLETAEKALADNQDGNLTIGLTEDVRRAQAQYDFFAAQKARVEKSLAAGDLVVDRMGDNPATPNEVETDFDLQDTPYTVEDYEALTDLQEAAGDAADDLKDAYDDRVAATDDLETKQRDTQTYLEQLVKLREYEQAVADAAAPEDAEEKTAAQKLADERLTTAEAQLATFGELQALGDGNPVKDLVTSLLEADGEDGDDDGQALVDAISSNHETASDAKTAADLLAAKVEALSGDDGEVAALTAMDDPATEDVDESGPITANTARSTDNAGNIAALTAMDDPATEDVDESGPITANTARSTDNAGNIAALTAMDDPATEDVDESGPITANTARSTDNAGNIAALTAMDDPATEDDESGPITANADDIAAAQTDIDANTTAITDEAVARAEADTALEGRIDTNWDAIAVNQTDIDANTTAITDEAVARAEADTALEGRIDTNWDAIAVNQTDIDANTTAITAEETARMAADAAEITARMAADTAEAEARAAADTAEATARADADAAEMTARMAADTAEAEARAAADTAEATARADADTALGGRIDTNVTNIASNTTAITAEETARMEGDTMLGGRIDAEEMARMAGDAANAETIMMNAGAITSNMADNMAAISGNSGMINDNRNMIGANSARIGELSDDLDIVRSGVAASMALAGMPHINGRGIAIGVGSFDGESAFAVGFQIQGEMASFQIGVTSSGGETGASAGVGFQF